MSDDPPEEPANEPLAIPIPVVPASVARLMAHAARHDDHHEMQRDALISEIYSYLDGLSVQDALTLRSILNMDQRSSMMQFFDGQLVGLLRYVHHVDPDTGKSPSEELGDVDTPATS